MGALRIVLTLALMLAAPLAFAADPLSIPAITPVSYTHLTLPTKA